MQVSDIINYIQDGQRIFHETVVDDLQLIKSTNSIVTTFNLTLVGFLYGALHAIGPGHGKMIVSSYLLANENSLKRGLMIVGLSSLLQAIVATLIVISFFYILNLARSQAEHATTILEVVSFSLVGLLGAGLMLRGIKEFFNLDASTHKHHHTHDGHKCCNHSHMPSPKEVDAVHDIGSMAVMITSIGIRPCSGAVLLLFFSCIIGALWAGILATFAMAVGTALTTGILAILTVKSKNIALRFLKTTDKGMTIAHAALSLAGGLIVLLFSVLFLSATLDNKNLILNETSNSNKMPLMHFPNSIK